MMHVWGFLSAANWGFAALMLAMGYGLGWWLRGLHESHEDTKALERIKQDQMAIYGGIIAPIPQRADTPGPRETQIAPITPQPVFQTRSGQVIESPRAWDQRLARFGGPEQIPYEELEGMFLDQFLLRYFYSLMPLAGSTFWSGMHQSPAPLPWTEFIASCPWAKEMPVLFEQMTGYKLNELQLNNAIAEWARRLSKPAPAAPECPRPDQKCRKCGAVGYAVNEFLSPHTGLCSVCSESGRAETSVQRESETTG